MNPIRIAIMTLTAVAASALAYSAFSPSPNTLLTEPAQTPVSALAANDAPNQTIETPSVQVQPEIQYVDAPMPSRAAHQDGRHELEDRDGELHDLE